MRWVPAEAVRREQHSGLLLAWLPAGRAQRLTTYQAEAAQPVAANVRTYLSSAYEDEDPATVRGYLPQLGFAHQYGSYVFPKGQQDRLAALGQLLGGLATHGLGSRKYGTAYWTALRDQYQQALQAAGSSAGTISTMVDKKNELLDQLREALTAIYYLLRAQYPKSWKTQLRAYGFQKERYS